AADARAARERAAAARAAQARDAEARQQATTAPAPATAARDEGEPSAPTITSSPTVSLKRLDVARQPPWRRSLLPIAAPATPIVVIALVGAYGWLHRTGGGRQTHARAAAVRPLPAARAAARPPVAAARAQLELVALPWGTLEQITDAAGKPLPAASLGPAPL